MSRNGGWKSRRGSATAESKTVLIADNHALVRHGVRALLGRRKDCTVCGEADTRERVLREVRSLKPGVVVLGNLSLQDVGTLIVEIRVELPDAEVLVLSTNSSDDTVRRAVTAGARGYVLTTDPGHEFLRAVKCLVRGRPYLSRKPAEDLANAVVNVTPNRPSVVSSLDKKLTPRETEVLTRLVNAESNKQIADTLKIGVRTVETHRARIMNKLGLHSVVELVRYALANDLVRYRELPPGLVDPGIGEPTAQQRPSPQS